MKTDKENIETGYRRGLAGKSDAVSLGEHVFGDDFFATEEQKRARDKAFQRGVLTRLDREAAARVEVASSDLSGALANAPLDAVFRYFFCVLAPMPVIVIASLVAVLSGIATLFSGFFYLVAASRPDLWHGPTYGIGSCLKWGIITLVSGAIAVIAIFRGPELTARVITAGNVTPGGWYLLIGRERVGPVNEQDVRAKLQAGRIDGGTLLWTAGMPGWKPLRTVPQFAHAD